MKPVLVLQHLDQDGPAYLATWLRQQGRAFTLLNTEAGQDFPERVDGHGALVVLGGEMGANDALPSLRQAERLIAQALHAGVPVLGLCLGAQLLARSLGAAVGASPAPEVGWQRLHFCDTPLAAHWFGEHPGHAATVFHWHYDGFDLPHGATRLAQTAACPQQAFCIGPHVGVQFHPELDAAKLQAWVAADDARYDALAPMASVQSRAGMLRDAPACLAAQQDLADHVYRRWLSSAA